MRVISIPYLSFDWHECFFIREDIDIRIGFRVFRKVFVWGSFYCIDYFPSFYFITLRIQYDVCSFGTKHFLIRVFDGA